MGQLTLKVVVRVTVLDAAFAPFSETATTSVVSVRSLAGASLTVQEALNAPCCGLSKAS